MLRSAASKVMWVGRATVFLVGLAVILALVFGAATTAMGANGNPFLLGKKNAASLLTKLTGNVNGAAMQVVNSNAGADDTALSLSVQAGEAPMKVNSNTRVANLNAARAGRADTAASADAATNAQNAANADTLDGKDSSVFLRDAYRESNAYVSSVSSRSKFCATTDYTPTHPQTALIDINASLAAGDSGLYHAYLQASYSTNGGADWSMTSDRQSPQVDIAAEREAALGYLDAFPLEPGVTYRFAAQPVVYGNTAIYDPSFCQVLVTFINR